MHMRRKRMEINMHQIQYMPTIHKMPKIRDETWTKLLKRQWNISITLMGDR